ncbi:MAG: nuclear transport factor 2 family protein [Gammaproteobacteria bacterium]|nr:nuclear transport factor 2 family protein [Gammaproteobacteria bacterium]
MASPVSSRTHGPWHLSLVATGVLSFATAMAGGHKTIGPRVEPEVPDEVRTGVTAIVEETANRWNSQDYATLLGLWDRHFEMKTIGSNPVGEDVRVSGVFRRTADGWRYIHYAESPKTAAVYLEDLMEKEVRPGWDEFFEQAKQRKREIARRKQQEAQQAPGSPAKP